MQLPIFDSPSPTLNETPTPQSVRPHGLLFPGQPRLRYLQLELSQWSLNCSTPSHFSRWNHEASITLMCDAHSLHFRFKDLDRGQDDESIRASLTDGSWRRAPDKALLTLFCSGRGASLQDDVREVLTDWEEELAFIGLQTPLEEACVRSLGVSWRWRWARFEARDSPWLFYAPTLELWERAIVQLCNTLAQPKGLVWCSSPCCSPGIEMSDGTREADEVLLNLNCTSEALQRFGGFERAAMLLDALARDDDVVGRMIGEILLRAARGAGFLALEPLLWKQEHLEPHDFSLLLALASDPELASGWRELSGFLGLRSTGVSLSLTEAPKRALPVPLPAPNVVPFPRSPSEREDADEEEQRLSA